MRIKKMWAVALKLSLVFLAFNVVQGENPVLDTPLGKVKGVILASEHNKPFYAFRGIPYAKSPIKERRFKPPEPIERWEHVHDATEGGHRCLQFDLLRNGLVTGDEDCLFLNVYSQKLSPTSLRPVMVFIHGGAFTSGDGMSDLYGPEMLLDRDIVLVTINYRLSALGFLSTGDTVSPGNYGLLDQVQALKWVRDNIAAFGGDPQSVTIFGESAGGASATFHLLSPLSKGLFHAAIPQSGTAVSAWAVISKEVSISFTKKLAESLKCPTENSETIVRCLRKRAALDIAMKSSLFESMNPKGNPANVLMFLPIVDGGFGEVEFLPRTPKQLLESGQVNSVPVMIGVCKDEGYIIAQMISARIGGIGNYRSENIVATFVNGSLAYENVDVNVLEQQITDYMAGIDPTDTLRRIKASSDLLGDAFFNHGVDETISGLVTNGVPTYPYKFTHKGQNSLVNLFAATEADAEYSEKLNIVTHGDELQYLFNIHVSPLGKLEKKRDIEMSDLMLTLWTNFAKNKVPSLEGATIAQYKPLEWTPMQPNRPCYLDLNLEPSMKSGLFNSRPDLWQTDKRKEEL